MARHLGPPEITRSEKIWRRSFRLDFWDQDGFVLIGYLPKDLTITRSVTHFCWCNWGTFWRRNAAGISQISSCSFKTMALLNGPLQPTRYWPTRVSNALITHSILWIWPLLTTACLLDWKNNWKFAIAAAETWLEEKFLITFQWLAKGRATGWVVYWCCGEYVEKIPSLVAVACFFPGRAKDL